MQVTIVVGEQERRVMPSGIPWWRRARADDTTPLAADEQGLLDELTLLCQDILLTDIDQHDGETDPVTQAMTL